MHYNRELAAAIKLLNDAGIRRRLAERGSPEHHDAALDEERLNAKVMELARERNRRSLIEHQAPAEKPASPVVRKGRPKLIRRPGRP